MWDTNESDTEDSLEEYDTEIRDKEEQWDKVDRENWDTEGLQKQTVMKECETESPQKVLHKEVDMEDHVNVSEKPVGDLAWYLNNNPKNCCLGRPE